MKWSATQPDLPLPSTAVRHRATTCSLGRRLANPYTFTGRRFDEETGIYQFRYRYYHAHLGRFLTRDPLGNVDGASLYENYFGVSFTDPEGTAIEPWPLPLAWAPRRVRGSRRLSNGLVVELDKNCPLSRRTKIMKALERILQRLNQLRGGVWPNRAEQCARHFFGDDVSLDEIGNVASNILDGLNGDGLYSLINPQVNRRLRIACGGFACRGNREAYHIQDEWKRNLHRTDIVICDSSGSGLKLRTRLFHELSHHYAKTIDFGYVDSNKDPNCGKDVTYYDSKQRSITLTRTQKLRNASTYEFFMNCIFTDRSSGEYF